MKISPFALALAAGVVMLGLDARPMKAQEPPKRPAEYRVRILWQKAARTAGGLRVEGRILNTGSLPLTYTRVAPTLRDSRGRLVSAADGALSKGYLTVSPLLPGAAADFRAYAADAPPFAEVRTTFREAGQPVQVEPSCSPQP